VNQLDKFYDAIIARIMKEIITTNKKLSINFQDFKTLMWNTNIDKTCVIYLDEE
jgi:hypothetical protein